MKSHGLVVGLLLEVHQDRIIVGRSTFFLRDGVQCGFAPGKRIQVVYTEQNGRRDADSVTLVP
jgi:uncharacterized protein YqfB (UPF0267 family)